MRILVFGDVVGPLGRAMFQKHVGRLKEEKNADMIIVNGENSSAQGRGITPRIVDFFKHNGANVITSGNHIWFKKEIYSHLEQHNDLLRPANYPAGCPGAGHTIVDINGVPVAVVNMQGRVFMRENVDHPFRAMDSLLTYLSSKAKVIIVDFHAEATSEKMAFANYLDGRVSAVVGTHTHVQTADARVLPHGTAYITDLGMAGAIDSLIGMKKGAIIQNFLTQMPTRFEVENEGPALLCGVTITVKAATGKAESIEPFYITDDAISMDGV